MKTASEVAREALSVEETPIAPWWSRSAAAWCGALAALAFLVRVGAWLWLDPANPIGDMHGYLRQAIRLVSGQGYEGTYVPPGYPVALAAAMRFLGTWMDAACVVNALLGSLTVISVFLASRMLLSPSLAAVAAAVVAFDPPEIIYASMVLSESLALALVAAAIAALAWRSTRNGSILGGLLLGLGALTRESLVVFLLLVSIALWRSRGWRLALAFLVAGLLPIVPWTIRNTFTTRHPILVSSRTGYNLLIGNNPFADGSQAGGKRIFQVVEPPVPEDLPAAERHVRGADYALAWIKGHPKEFVAKGLMGVLRMFGLDRQFLYSLREDYYARHPGRAATLLVAIASAGSWLIVLPLAILGVMAGEPWLRALGLCAFQWIGILGFTVFGEWRFRVPVLPIFVLLAVSAGNAWARGEIRPRSWVVLALVMTPVLAYWVWEVLERAEEAARILG